jgi:NAD(P)-dependent dehydrogenase (short-subunit alcohol dehydrogenase family)
MPNPPVVLITGGSGGLGLAVARRFHEAGHAVALLDRGSRRSPAGQPPPVASVGTGPEVLHVTADVSERAAVERAVAEVGERLGAPTVLVNAAGLAESRPLLPPDDALFDRTFAVNVKGAWIASTAVLPAMLAAKHGAIVNVASTAALKGSKYVAAYVASKHALLGLTRALAEDLRGKGVTVNAVCPGFLDTPMTERTVANIVRATGRTPEAARAEIAALNDSGRLIAPDEVADAILALALDPRRSGEHVVVA